MKRITRSISRREPEPPATLHIVDRLPLSLRAKSVKSKSRSESNPSKCDFSVLSKEKLQLEIKATEEKEHNGKWIDDFVRDINPTKNFKAIEGVSRSPTPTQDDKLAIEWKNVKKEEPMDIDSFETDNEQFCDELEENDYSCPIPGVLGYGKGVQKGLPKYEFRSVYQYTIPELDAKDPAPWRLDPALPPKSLKPTVLSVVASVSLGRALNLEDIAIRGTNLHYDPESFTPLVMRLKKPTATALIFKSGKMVVTGTKSEEECRTAARRFGRLIQKLGFRVSIMGLQIQNITATANLGFRVRVHLLGKDKNLSTQVGYHPELFTGVSVPLTTPRGKVIIFRTGAILITGVKSAEEVMKAIYGIYPLAKLYAN